MEWELKTGSPQWPQSLQGVGRGVGGGGACRGPGLPPTSGDGMVQIEDTIAAAHRQFFLHLLFVSFLKDILVPILSHMGKMTKSLDEDFFLKKDIDR